MAARIPDAISHILQTPSEGSLILLTGIQNATANWLVIRYLYAALSKDEAHPDNAASVVLCSYLRDFSFWQGEARRVGLNLNTLKSQNRFAFVDGLTSLFGSTTSNSQTTSPVRSQPSIPGRTPLSSRGVLSSRAAPSQLPQDQPAPAQPTSKTQSSPTLQDPTLSTLQKTLLSASSSLSSPKILILDTPSLLLTTSPEISSHTLLATLMTLRTHFHSVVLSLPADGPLLAASPLSSFNPANQWDSTRKQNLTVLDEENASFIVGAAHTADLCFSCRGLESGVAGDVSGVLRVTEGGGIIAGDDDRGGSGDSIAGNESSSGKGAKSRGSKEGEWLYFVGGDGNVKVWERGAGP